MKTIILTSAGFRSPQLQNDLFKILPKPPSQTKTAHILTASKVSPDGASVDRERKVLSDLGFQVEEVDIEGKSSADLNKIFEGKDVIYVQGGNTFYLLKAVRESGFDRVVKNLIGKGVIYIGVSAGSYICCPTIEMSTWKDPERPRFGLTDLTAMNLVPFLLFVHYKPEYGEIVKKGAAASAYPVRVLTDDQAFLVRNGVVELMGEGPEIVWSGKAVV